MGVRTHILFEDGLCTDSYPHNILTLLLQRIYFFSSTYADRKMFHHRILSNVIKNLEFNFDVVA